MCIRDSYLWLPVSDLFSSVLARIQVLMLRQDIEQLFDPYIYFKTHFPETGNHIPATLIINQLHTFHVRFSLPQAPLFGEDMQSLRSGDMESLSLIHI